MDSEKVLERKLVKAVQERNGLCVKLLSDYCTGLPDRMCLLSSGFIAFVELKSEGKKPRLIQQLIHNKLISLGFDVKVISTEKELQKFIKSLPYEDSL